jgi:hypothetical protein
MRLSDHTRDYLSLMAAVVVSRWLFRSHYLYDMDSVNFALGLAHFSPELQQPQPPGYFLYIQLGRVAQFLFPDANNALVALSILGSVASAGVIYALARAWFGREAARFAGLLFVFSPLAWFHGIVALTYILEACFTGLVGLLCWHVYTGRSSMAVPAAMALGIAVGMRQSTILFLAPLWLLSLQKTNWRTGLVAVFAFTVTVSVWFLPMLAASGGAEEYFSALRDSWARVSGAPVSLTLGWLILSVLRAGLSLATYGICFGTAAPLLFLRSLSIPFKPGLKMFLAAWLIPGLLFFTLVFFAGNNLGHLLFLAVPLFALLGAKGAIWYNQSLASQRVKLAAIGAFAAINVAIFLYPPFYTSYRAITQYEHELATIPDTLRKMADPSDTVIVAMDAHWFGFRHAGYYLPEYLVLQYPEMKFAAGIRVFVMRSRDTQLLKTLTIGHYKRFLLFPFPGDSPSDQQYIKSLLDRFPKGTLTTISAGGHEYVMGPVAYLDRLFPKTASVSQAVP